MNGFLTFGEMSFSTADIEEDLFMGEHGPLKQVSYITVPSEQLPSGVYRVIDGELFQVVDEPLELGHDGQKKETLAEGHGQLELAP